jgi:hypothetical protein
LASITTVSAFEPAELIAAIKPAGPAPIMQTLVSIEIFTRNHRMTPQ